MARYEEAKESYLSAIILKPIDQKSLFNLGVTLQELNKHEEAIEYFEKVIALNSKHSETQYSKGLSLQRLKKWHLAIASYDIAISIDPEHFQAYNNRGMALKELKNFKNYTFIKLDICKKSKVIEICKKFKINYILHLAAQAGVRYSIKNPDFYIKNNLIGFFNVIDAARLCKIKHFVYDVYTLPPPPPPLCSGDAAAGL
jgi:tetratricopeptide (TPR) repeat protein